jgi:hypothetical protein
VHVFEFCARITHIESLLDPRSVNDVWYGSNLKFEHRTFECTLHWNTFPTIGSLFSILFVLRLVNVALTGTLDGFDFRGVENVDVLVRFGDNVYPRVFVNTRDDNVKLFEFCTKLDSNLKYL